jgi:hypothetical protein
MTNKNDARLILLHDHYKDSFAHLREYVKLRDLFFMYLLAGLVALFLDIKPSNESATLLSRILASHAGIEILKPYYVRALMWFIMLFLIIRYFQITLLIERQYPYIHRLESELNELYEKSLFGREGEAYLKNYPHFGDWVHFLYGWAFPILLLLAVSIKIILEIHVTESANLPLFIDGSLYCISGVTVGLYLKALHCKS